MFKLSPITRFHVVAYLDANARNAGVPQYHSDSFEVDLARQSFADAFVATVMVMFRTAKKPMRRNDVHALLGKHAASKLPLVDEQLERWLSGGSI